MSSTQLQRLWQLHKVDSGIVEIRRRAAGLDPGRAIMAELQRLEADHDKKAGEVRRLSSEQADLELAQKGIDEKLKKIDKELYGGGVVSPKEVQAFEKEVEALKKRREAGDEKLLALYDQLPAAKLAAEEAKAQIEAKKVELAEYQKKLVGFKHQLESEFKRLTALRPQALDGIDSGLLARYETIRQRQGGVAMAELTKQARCSACGMSLPEKTIEEAKEGRAATCESCHRLLYYAEDLI